jgi:threonine dehydrogenase-like Zn-dependent dehydrogenase
MKAAVMRAGQIVFDQVPEPAPAEGQVLVRTLACGICGSDLHFVRYAPELLAAARDAHRVFTTDLDRDIVMGHEFCAEVLEYGPGCEERLALGARVTAVPVGVVGGQVATIGYSNDLPGGYGELMVLPESTLLEVPAALGDEHAALTEPMAVGLHAVVRGQPQPDHVVLVIGCGPIGLAVIQALRLYRPRAIVAADFSPQRRQLARLMGADAVVDPRQESPYEKWLELASTGEAAPSPLGPAFPPLPGLRPALFFECVGVPGVIDQLMEGAPPGARIVVVGACMQEDRIRPIVGINKRLQLEFVLGYSSQEFADTLGHLAAGRLDGAPMITGKVGADGVAQAFVDLGDPERHAKILVEPWR